MIESIEVQVENGTMLKVVNPIGIDVSRVIVGLGCKDSPNKDSLVFDETFVVVWDDLFLYLLIVVLQDPLIIVFVFHLDDRMTLLVIDGAGVELKLVYINEVRDGVVIVGITNYFVEQQVIL